MWLERWSKELEIKGKLEILLGATTLGQSGPGSDGNQDVLRIPQSSIIIDGLDHRVVKIGWNTKKSPEDLRRFAATQTPIRTGIKNSKGVKS